MLSCLLVVLTAPVIDRDPQAEHDVVRAPEKWTPTGLRTWEDKLSTWQQALFYRDAQNRRRGAGLDELDLHETEQVRVLQLVANFVMGNAPILGKLLVALKANVHQVYDIVQDDMLYILETILPEADVDQLSFLWWSFASAARNPHDPSPSALREEENDPGDDDETEETFGDIADHAE